jgi:hypothetical protein
LEAGATTNRGTEGCTSVWFAPIDGIMRATWVSSGSQLVCCSTAVVRFVGTTT